MNRPVMAANTGCPILLCLPITDWTQSSISDFQFRFGGNQIHIAPIHECIVQVSCFYTNLLVDKTPQWCKGIHNDLHISDLMEYQTADKYTSLSLLLALAKLPKIVHCALLSTVPFLLGHRRFFCNVHLPFCDGNSTAQCNCFSVTRCQFHHKKETHSTIS